MKIHAKNLKPPVSRPLWGNRNRCDIKITISVNFHRILCPKKEMVIFMFDDDFSSETGRYADLNDDGKVDFAEYLNDCDDFDRIYKKGNYPYGKYTPPQQSSNEPPKIYCAWGIVGWILALIGCFAPTINTLIYTDGDEIGFGIILTIILLIAWIWGFSNRAK